MKVVRFVHLGCLCLVALQVAWAQVGPFNVSDQEFSQSFTSNSVQAGAIRWHYVAGGSGDVVVLLHGWPQTWLEWRDIPTAGKRYPSPWIFPGSVIRASRNAMTKRRSPMICAPESGHWIPEEQPVWLARRIMDFMAAN